MSEWGNKPDHPQHIWALFHRKGKAAPELVYVTTGGALQVLLAQKELAKRLKTRVGNIEVSIYRPAPPVPSRNVKPDRPRATLL